jgi:hypothetical protein
MHEPLADLGADLRIKSYNFHYQIFVCILRFAAFFFAGFGIQVSCIVFVPGISRADSAFAVRMARLVPGQRRGVLGDYGLATHLLAGFVLGRFRSSQRTSRSHGQSP